MIDESKIAIEENDSKMMNFLYHSIFGRLILKILIRPTVSKIAGWFMDTKVSTVAIKRFIEKNNIDLNEYEDKKYVSYNDFFTRKIKEECRKIDMNKKSLISPCDSKLTAYKISDNSIFSIKNSYYKVEDLLKNKELSKKYKGGYCLIFRLCVDDYHRYCYIDNGKKEENTFIKGVLYTVRPIALEQYNIYKENSREYTILNTENFGNVVHIEVGATMIGRIKNYHETYEFSKGEEKGMFLFGGSTIVLLIEKDKVEINKNILENTKSGYETVVKLGEKIGTKKSKK
ncbi:MAG: phosphatidylserine decarboxylase [Firmicutes bacterium]|nr:phosphatidylserine decarboxylase [Bacillota bacterium]